MMNAREAPGSTIAEDGATWNLAFSTDAEEILSVSFPPFETMMLSARDVLISAFNESAFRLLVKYAVRPLPVIITSDGEPAAL